MSDYKNVRREEFFKLTDSFETYLDEFSMLFFIYISRQRIDIGYFWNWVRPVTYYFSTVVDIFIVFTVDDTSL